MSLTRSSMLFVLIMCSSIAVGQDFVVDLDVMLSGRIEGNYCGPATAQMTMMGYPDAGSRKCIPQEKIKNEILEGGARCVTEPWSVFATDPQGLQGAIMQLDPPPPPGRYVIFQDTVKENVMFDVMYWMAKLEYPTPVLIASPMHWVAITGFRADVDPRDHHDVVLKQVTIHDSNSESCGEELGIDDPCTPQDEGDPGGCIKIIAGSTWYGESAYWKHGNSPAYENDDTGEECLIDLAFVAVVEPPLVKGLARPEPRKFVRKPVAPTVAADMAARHLAALQKHGRPDLERLRGARPGKPLLVNPSGRAYYLIPFEHPPSGVVHGAVLLGTQGEFEEVVMCACPLRYLTRNEAIDIARCTLPGESVSSASAELVFKVCDQTESRQYPVWEVTLTLGKGRIVRYVTQHGLVFPKLTGSIGPAPGGPERERPRAALR